MSSSRNPNAFATTNHRGGDARDGQRSRRDVETDEPTRSGIAIPVVASGGPFDTLSVLLGVLVPTIAKGVIIRRPLMVALAEKLGLDDAAVVRLQRLRRSYGDGPVLLRLPFRTMAVVLAPDDVHRILEETPEPFSTASMEKRAALSHFEPKGSLISHGTDRADRRRFNEDVLDHHREVHRLADRFVTAAGEEASQLRSHVRRRGALTWDTFSDAWFRLVRRVVFGDGAANDHELSSLTAQLRSDANWAFLKPKRHHLRRRFFRRIGAHLARAEAGSLAGVIATVPKTGVTAPEHQVPQYLFAFDPAGMTTFRSLALLATHPQQLEQAQEEIRTSGERHHLPFLRATVLESLRLWPTTPLVLRETTRAITWPHGTMPGNTGVVIFAPYFHRDDERLPYAHRFTPELWLQERTRDDWPLIPFSGGPGICPARHLVQMLSSAMIAALIEGRGLDMERPSRMPPERLPGTLDNYSLRFRLRG
jgi:cytochrome P450